MLVYLLAMILDIFTEKGPMLTYGLIIDLLVSIPYIFKPNQNSLRKNVCWEDERGLFLVPLVVLYDIPWLITYVVFAARDYETKGLYIACCFLLSIGIITKVINVWQWDQDFETQINMQRTQVAEQQVVDHQQVLPQIETVRRSERRTSPKTSQVVDLPPSYEDVMENNVGSTDF